MRPAVQRALLGLLGLLLGAALGTWGVGAFGDRFVAPSAPDPAAWELVSPNRGDLLTAPELGRGTQVRGGLLHLGEHAFGRSDTLRPADDRPVGEVRLEVASGVVRLNFSGSSGGPRTSVYLRPGGIQLRGGEPGAWTEIPPGPVRFTVEDGQVLAHIGGEVRPLGPTRGGTVELLSGGAGAVRSVTLVDRTGAIYLDQDFRQLGARAPAWAGAAVGALTGLCLGLCAAAGPSAAAAGLVLLLPPLWVLRTPFDDWVTLVEDLYLTHTTAWELARLSLALSLVPLVLLALLETLPPLGGLARRRQRRLAWLHAAAALAAGLLASRDGDWLWLIPGLPFLLLPWLLSVRAHLPPLGWLLRDLPALAAVAWLGWPLGLLPAALWRFVPVLSSSRLLLQHAPRAATDHLFLLTLALPFAAEAALRATYLDRAWRPEQLTARQPDTTAGLLDAGFTPFWSARCGPEDAERVYSVVFAGGSSTGGAYQFRSEPEAFYPARAHEKLCALLPEGAALVSWNYGAGGRDTHVLARALGGIIEHTDADAVVLYVGVNDILTSYATMTRRQREARQEAGGRVTSALAALAGRSRLVTGVALWSRRSRAEEVEPVSEVPLPDARDNLETIAELTASAGVELLLASQLVAPSHRETLAPYWAMEAELAAAEHVRFVDVRPALESEPVQQLLLDDNHLSRAGNDKLADVLLPAIREALGL